MTTRQQRLECVDGIPIRALVSRHRENENKNVCRSPLQFQDGAL